MTAIFICGEKGDRDFERLFREILSENYRITYIRDRSVFQWGKGYELVTADLEKFEEIYAEKPVFLLKKDCVPHFAFPEDSMVIAFSENEKQLTALKNQPIHPITCGFGKTDSFSYSSLSDEKIVVSLNREITALSGKKMQPLELPLEIPKGVELYSVIAFTALRIMLDDYNSEIGELI
ncbi:MAG: hypothetical protein HDT44_07705 [Ruminococcaceae bacterium]|nr:hypothetical protein [Oscillospiraceae bacterium]